MIINTANLKKRIIFVLWAIPLSWLLINTSQSLWSLLPLCLKSPLFTYKIRDCYPGQILGLVLIIMGCYEYLQLMKRLFHHNGFWLIYVWLVLPLASFFIPSCDHFGNYSFFILLTIALLEAFIWGKNSQRWLRVSLFFSGSVFFTIACIALFNFYASPFQSIFTRNTHTIFLSQAGIITILMAIFCCDSAAYFVGSLFGKHHFSSISPKKTIEGSIAGFCAATLTTTIGWYFFADQQYSLVSGILLGMLIGVCAQIGDLSVSLIKRFFEVKDSSNIIPGHGGILDRFDSLFFTAPAIHLFILFMKLVKW